MQTEEAMKEQPDYKITYSESVEPSYMDGFADGYSRAWLDCWEYLTSGGVTGGSAEKPKDPANE